jgi:hypothetical protein
MDPDLMELKVAVARLATQVEFLAKTVEKHSETIEELLELSNKGKGAAWLLISLGGIAGAAATKLVQLVPVVFK